MKNPRITKFISIQPLGNNNVCAKPDTTWEWSREDKYMEGENRCGGEKREIWLYLSNEVI